MKNNLAFIFDLDGVIVDTAKFHFLAWQNLAKKVDIHFTEKENEQLKGVSRVKSLEKILAWGNKTISEERFQNLMDDKNKDYLSYVHKMTKDDILPGVIDFLKVVKSKGHPVALGTASKNSLTILKAVGLTNMFDAIVDGNKVTKAKPDPEVFLKAADLLNTPPEDCIVFEDSIAGVKAANTGNMLSIGIGEKSVLNEADHCFKNFTEFDYQFFENIEVKN